MGTIATAFAGIAANLRTVAGLTVYETIPSKIQPPCAALGLRRIEYDETGSRGTDKVTVDVIVAVSRTDNERSQVALHGLLDKTGSASLKAAIEADSDLGGAVGDLRVINVDRVGEIVWAGVSYLGAFLTVEVYL